jgi:hypothetical protein
MTLTDDPSMDKGWLYRSIIIGLVASLVAFAILVLTSGIAGSISYDQPNESNSLFGLTLIGLLLLELACGMSASLFARPAKGKPDHWLKAALVAGFLPAVALCSFMLNNWRNSAPVYAPGTRVQISEPAPGFIVCGVLLFLMSVCLLASVIGGLVTQFAKQRNEKQ